MIIQGVCPISEEKVQYFLNHPKSLREKIGSVIQFS